MTNLTVPRVAVSPGSQELLAMSGPAASVAQQHVLTIALEDYFHVGAFNQLIRHGQWYRFETRLETSTRKTLALLDRYQIKATFFVLGWVADRCPELVREVAEKGHEIASKGYYHRTIRQMTPSEFREDLARAREALEKASGTRVLGYRVADDWFHEGDLWGLNVLAEEGYAYDSSIAPRWRDFAEEPWRRFLHENRTPGGSIWEFPISSVRLLRWVLPIGGGNYFRQFPQWLMRRAVRRWHRVYQVPFVMYFHVWELDPDQPRISSASWLTRIRHYRNLHKMESILEHYIKGYPFTSIAGYLGLNTQLPTPSPLPCDNLSSIGSPTEPGSDSTNKTPVSVVTPCFNEELILPYLANTLKSVKNTLREQYDLHFVFVNDGSRDGTADALEKIFGPWANCQIVHHPLNQGVTAAILNGIRAAKTEIVCSLDCDCTYDPHEIASMIPLLTEGVDVVTASPYHPRGQVRNVPGWRLFLSRGSSFLYRRVLKQKLYTYTSCFRVYRRSAVVNLQVKEKGFLGIAEILGKLDLQGSRIVEYPAVLEVRMLGRSKMKTLRTILGHLRLMARLAWQRMCGGEKTNANIESHQSS